MKYPKQQIQWYRRKVRDFGGLKKGVNGGCIMSTKLLFAILKNFLKWMAVIAAPPWEYRFI